MMRVALACVVLAGCLESELVLCGNGLACPVGTLCDEVHQSCATAEQFSACAGVSDNADCTAGGIDGGCFDGVCLRRGCANRVVEADEQCDDGNERGGDGCSADCRSTEMCGNGYVDRGEQCDDGSLLSRDGCDSRCRAELSTWRAIPVTVAVNTDLVADDEAGQRLLSPGYVATWELVGDRWREIAPSTIARTPFYDSSRGQVVALFSGVAKAFDGTTWTALTSDPLSYLSLHAATFDRVKNEPIIFADDRVFTFSGGSWKPYATALPPATNVSYAAFDVATGEIVALANGGGETYLDTMMDSSWQGRTTPFSSIDAIGLDGTSVIVLSGISLYRRTATGWQTNVGENLAATIGLGTFGAGIIYRRGSELVIDRGWERCRRSSLTTMWSCAVQPFSGKLAQDPGGHVSLFTPERRWELTTELSAPIATPGLPTDFQLEQVTYSSGRGTTVAVGVSASCGCGIETYALGPSGWTSVASPMQNYSDLLAYDPDLRALVRFIGFGGTAPFIALADDGAAWVDTTIPDPPAGFVNLVWDTRLHHLVGLSIAPFTSFTYDHVDATTWEEDALAPAGSLAADERRGSLITVSDDGGSKVWERRAGVWTELSRLPYGATSEAWAYESAIGRLFVLVYTGDERHIAYAHEWTSETPLETCEGDSDVDGDGLAGCADPDCYWACSGCPPYATCRFDLAP